MKQSYLKCLIKLQDYDSNFLGQFFHKDFLNQYQHVTCRLCCKVV